MQASASGLLEEVKKKKTDIKQLLELCEALKELRALRREASRKKGEQEERCVEVSRKGGEQEERCVEVSRKRGVWR